jgi:hypothetical protein
MIKSLWNSNRPLTAVGLAMLPVLAGAVLGLIFDPRVITGAPAWLKPAKFSVSIAIYVFTLAWVFKYLPERKRTRGAVGWITAVVMVFEIVVICLQAYRGRTSHFNNSTPLDAALFRTMGGAIVLQTLTSGAVAYALWRQRFEDVSIGWALRLGLTITIIGAFVGALMTAPTSSQLAAARAGSPMTVIGSHTVGGIDGGPGLPGAGWSTEYGDLRVAHFLGLHALQSLILIALGLRRLRMGEHERTQLTQIGAASYFALFVILLTQALRGQPVSGFEPLSMGLLGAWAVVTAGAAVLTVRRGTPSQDSAFWSA